MQYKAFNIRYDTNGDDEIAESLPKALTVELNDNQNPSVDIANAVFDKVGFCILVCEFRPFCKYCGTVMFEENSAYCCDECGATLSVDCQEWTKPSVPIQPKGLTFIVRFIPEENDDIHSGSIFDALRGEFPSSGIDVTEITLPRD